MVNVLQAMILTQGPKMVLTPTYHVFHMFRPFQDATFLPTDLQTPATRSATHPFQRSAFRLPGLPRAPSSLHSSSGSRQGDAGLPVALRRNTAHRQGLKS